MKGLFDSPVTTYLIPDMSCELGQAGTIPRGLDKLIAGENASSSKGSDHATKQFTSSAECRTELGLLLGHCVGGQAGGVDSRTHRTHSWYCELNRPHKVDLRCTVTKISSLINSNQTLAFMKGLRLIVGVLLRRRVLRCLQSPHAVEILRDFCKAGEDGGGLSFSLNGLCARGAAISGEINPVRSEVCKSKGD